MNLSNLLFFAVFASFIGCGGLHSQTRMPQTPTPETQANLVGPLCKGMHCECSTDPQEAGSPPAGFKRFQIKLGPSQTLLWAMIDKQVFHKGIERATNCFYVDLPKGDHPISMWASGKDGFGAQVTIREIGGQAPWYYDTFSFHCGTPELCDLNKLETWKTQIASVNSGKHAPCGSVRIFGIDWLTGRTPDNLHPTDLYLKANMKVYKFAPEKSPGSEDCIKK